jgi:hypothetical protein
MNDEATALFDAVVQAVEHEPSIGRAEGLRAGFPSTRATDG